MCALTLPINTTLLITKSQLNTSILQTALNRPKKNVCMSSWKITQYCTNLPQTDLSV